MWAESGLFLSKNETNQGFFQIRVQYIFARYNLGQNLIFLYSISTRFWHEPKWTEIWSGKVLDLSLFGANLTHFRPKSGIPENVSTRFLTVLQLLCVFLALVMVCIYILIYTPQYLIACVCVYSSDSVKATGISFFLLNKFVVCDKRLDRMSLIYCISTRSLSVDVNILVFWELFKVWI